MSLNSIVGAMAASSIGDIFSGIGKMCTSIRSAITGEMTPENKAKIEQMLIALEVLNTKLEVHVKEIQANVIIAESVGESWLQRNWRPVLMMVLIAIVANNYIIIPWLSTFWDNAPNVPIPDKVWTLLTAGVGGYIVGRSGEKISENVGTKSKGKDDMIRSVLSDETISDSNKIAFIRKCMR